LGGAACSFYRFDKVVDSPFALDAKKIPLELLFCQYLPLFRGLVSETALSHGSFASAFFHTVLDLFLHQFFVL